MAAIIGRADILNEKSSAGGGRSKRPPPPPPFSVHLNDHFVHTEACEPAVRAIECRAARKNSRRGAGARRKDQAMAVEAQLCPQCGAAVQFPAGQTEVVCAHCGTTVARLAAAPATSVEKELEAENLIQQTV